MFLKASYFCKFSHELLAEVFIEKLYLTKFSLISISDNFSFKLRY